LKADSAEDTRNKSKMISGNSISLFPGQSHHNKKNNISQEDATNRTTSRLEVQHQVVSPLSRKDIFYKGSISNLREYQQSQRSLHSYHQSVFIIPKESFEKIPSLLQTTPPTIVPPPKNNKCGRFHCGSAAGSFRSSLSQMIDCSLLRNPVFLFIGISNVFAMLGYYVPVIYLTDAAINKVILYSDLSLSH
jgi:hypothetical protein